MKESMGANCIKIGTAFSGSEPLKKTEFGLIRKCGHTCNIQTSKSSLQQVSPGLGKRGQRCPNSQCQPKGHKKEQASKLHVLEMTSSLGNRETVMIIEVFAGN